MTTRERIEQIRANNDARNWPWRDGGIWQKLPREAQITETYELLDAIDELYARIESLEKVNEKP